MKLLIYNKSQAFNVFDIVDLHLSPSWYRVKGSLSVSVRRYYSLDIRDSFLRMSLREALRSLCA